MEQLKNPLVNGHTFSIESFFKGGWDLVNKEFGVFVGMTLLIFAISVISSFIPGLNLVSNILQYIFAGGYFIYFRNLKSNTHKPADFFNGFKYTLNIVMYLLLLFLFYVPFVIIAFSVIFPFEIFIDFALGGFKDQDIAREIGQFVLAKLPIFLTTTFFFTIFSIYIYVSYTFVIPLIVDAKLGFWQAMETSRKVVGQKFLTYFLWYIVGAIILTIATIISCGLGLLIIIPISYGIVFSAYDQIFGEDYKHDLMH